MGRKKKHPEHVNHERWLVSYADFITLLFAFFVVMFAVSQVDSKKVGRFTESFSKAVGIDIFPDSGHGLLPGGIRPDPASASQSTGETAPMPGGLDGLKQTIISMGGRAELPASVEVVARRNELVIRLAEGLLFEVGDAGVREPSVKALQALARELRSRNVDIRIEGHTDDRPIRTSRFHSNWELSTARATAVVALLAREGIDAPRLSAAGYGEFHPLGPNETEEGRRKNRRVDIVVSVTPPGGP